MSKVVVRTNIPYNSISKMLCLAQRIIEQNHESPGIIESSDLVAFESNKNLAELKWTEAQSLHAAAEAMMQEAENLIGIRKGKYVQNQKQLYRVILRVRDELLLKYNNNPEHLSLWGFDIVNTKYMPGPKRRKNTEEIK